MNQVPVFGAHFFGQRKTLPDNASTLLRFPKWLDEFYKSREAANAIIEERLEHHLRNARREIREKGWKYLGAEKAKKVSPFKQARSWEVFDKLDPQLATLGLTDEEREQRLERRKKWHASYDDCRDRLLAGETDILWPPGTWAMVEFFGQKAQADDDPALAA